MRRTTATKLPLLDNLRIASPCSESWDGMVGDDRVRFCGGCMKNVYNVSAMSAEEAREVIEEKEGDVCVRLYRRKDGTVITSDCPVGERRKRVTKIAAAAMAFGGAGLALAALPSPEADEQPCDIPARTVTAPATGGPGTWAYDLLGGDDHPRTQPTTPPVEPHRVEMGDISEVVQPTPRPRMGRMAPVTNHRPDDQVPQL